MLARLDELKDYDYYFQYTVNAYGREAEPKIPPLNERLETFVSLSERIGKERVIWRYDPIIFSDVYTPEYHLKSFAEINNDFFYPDASDYIIEKKSANNNIRSATSAVSQIIFQVIRLTRRDVG